MAVITFIARMTVKPGREREFAAHCRELEEYVRNEEPDVLLYKFYKLREPGRYAILEAFPSEAVEQRHMSSKRLAEVAPRLADCLEGTWVREYFDPLE